MITVSQEVQLISASKILAALMSRGKNGTILLSTRPLSKLKVPMLRLRSLKLKVFIFVGYKGMVVHEHRLEHIVNYPKSRNRRNDICSQALINTAVGRQQSVGPELTRTFLMRAGFTDATISRVISGTDIRPLPLRKNRGRPRRVGRHKISAILEWNINTDR